MIHINNTLTLKKSKTKQSTIKILLSYFLSFIVFGLIILLVANPAKYTKSITSGFLLFANAVFPGLFPFLVLTKLLSSFNIIDKIASYFSKITKKVFKISGIASFVFILSALCGYPMGAKMTADLHQSNKISDEEAPYIFMLSSVSGPMFIIGAIGSAMLNNAKAGLIIYIAHIVSALICAYIFCNNKKRKLVLKQQTNKLPISQININYGQALSDSVYSATQTIIVVGAYITIFFMLIDMLIGTHILSPLEFVFKQLFLFFGINPNVSHGTACAVVEMTRGASEIAKFGTNAITVSLICAIVSFGGFSIIAQSLALGKKSKPKTATFIFYKLCHAIIAFLLCLVFCKILL